MTDLLKITILKKYLKISGQKKVFREFYHSAGQKMFLFQNGFQHFIPFLFCIQVSKLQGSVKFQIHAIKYIFLTKMMFYC